MLRMGGGLLTQLVLDAHVSVNGSKNSYCIIMSLLHQLTFDKQFIISLRKGSPYEYILNRQTQVTPKIVWRFAQAFLANKTISVVCVPSV